MTLTKGQGHRLTLTIHSRLLKLGPKVTCGETFKMTCLRVTLRFSQGHKVTLTEGQKVNIGHILDTIYSRLSKLGQKVACGESFKMT